jgi:ligand-binding sensor domain-containing protein
VAQGLVNWRPWLLGVMTGLLMSTPAAGLDPTRPIAQMSHRTFTRDDGLSGGVYGIAQTPDGYLWVATPGGLYRFDGVRFEHMSIEGMPSSDIYSLSGTASGDLWVSYTTGGLSRLRGGVAVNYPAGAGGPAFSVRKVLEAPNGGGLWAVASLTPWRFDGRSWREVPGPWAPQSEKGGGVWATQPGRDGTVWAKDGKSVFYCRPGCARFATANGYAGGVMGFARGHDGRVWTSRFPRASMESSC